MTEELRPLVDATYATDGRNNILWGDSFGGLFALHVLFNHPAAYQTYLVGSPSINWSGGAILEDEINLAAQVAAGEVAPRDQIGRASCRARVCQYVYISGVAGSLKKINHTNN